MSQFFIGSLVRKGPFIIFIFHINTFKFAECPLMNYDDILHKYLLYSIYYRLKSAAGPLTVDRNAGACAGRSGGVEHLPADPTKLKFLDFRKGPKTCKYRGHLGSHQPDELKNKEICELNQSQELVHDTK